MKKKNATLIILAVVVISVIVFFAFGSNSSSKNSNIDSEANSETESETKLEPISEEILTDSSNWRNIEITNVLTNEKHIVSQTDKPVLLESFAVWCPTCTRQQKIVKDLHEELGDSFISISLDTDPNEDANQVITHANNNGFDWIYAISPIEMTQSLIDEFGVGVVNAPSVPMVLVCPNSGTKFLDRGIKTVLELKQELNAC